MYNADETFHKLLFRKKGPNVYRCAFHVSPYERLYRQQCGGALCPGSIAERDFYVCPNTSCAYALCTECAPLGFIEKRLALFRSVFASTVRAGAFQIFGFVLLLLLQVLFFPLMKRALYMLYCHREVQCEFPLCYGESSPYFISVIAVSSVTLILLLLEIATVVVALLGRKSSAARLLNLDDIPRPIWAALLSRDTTIMKDMYAPFKHSCMVTHGLLFLSKLFQLLPLVFLNRDSLGQIGAVGAVEVVLAAGVLKFTPHSDRWVGFSYHIGGCHITGQLCLVLLYRWTRATGGEGSVWGYAMVAWFLLYCLLQLVAIFFGFLLHLIRRKCNGEKNEGTEEQEQPASMAAQEEGSPAEATTAED